MCDIIGDVDGLRGKLEYLKMRCTNQNGTVVTQTEWPCSSVTILTGADSQGTLKIVRSIVENEIAIALIGNHELNAVRITEYTRRRRYILHEIVFRLGTFIGNSLANYLPSTVVSRFVLPIVVFFF